jgi:hypothetical protein
MWTKIKKMAWDAKDNTIRGGFVNLVITVNLMAMIWMGVLSDVVSLRLERMTALMSVLFGASFGVWKAAKTVKDYLSRRKQDNAE